MMDSIRQYLRRALSQELRIRIATVRRRFADLVTGRGISIVAPTSRISNFEKLHVITRATQPIRRSEHWQGKLQNLRRGAELIHAVVIPPGRVLSFWALVGPPIENNGFATGRAIRADQVGADVGGGLCQLSGLIYELGLRAGMAVVERHPHSQDLYTDATRFTPLGLDATVVWGYKDLRLRQVGETPLTFVFYVNDESIEGVILAPKAFVPVELHIVQTEQHAPHCCNVRVWRLASSRPRELISNDYYVRNLFNGESVKAIDQRL